MGFEFLQKYDATRYDESRANRNRNTWAGFTPEALQKWLDEYREMERTGKKATGAELSLKELTTIRREIKQMELALEGMKQ